MKANRSTADDNRGLFKFSVGILISILFFGGHAFAQTASYKLGITNLIEAAAGATDSVILAVSPPSAAWSASSSNSWLHLSAASQSGTGSTNIIFTCDANPGPVRTGTILIADQSLVVTQAASNYTATSLTTPIGIFSHYSYGVAVDGSGNVFYSDRINNVIKEWIAASNVVVTVISNGLAMPQGLAVDVSGNIYIGDTGDNAIKLWSPQSNSLTTLVSGLSAPVGVAVDASGNLYFADTGNKAVKMMPVASTNIITLVSSNLSSPQYVAVDIAGNVYITDNGNKKLFEYLPSSGTVATLLSGLVTGSGVGVDGGGNIYFANAGSSSSGLSRLSATTGSTTAIALPPYGDNAPSVVAVNAAGEVFFSDTLNSQIKIFCSGFVDTTPKSYPLVGSNSFLPILLSVPSLPSASAPNVEQSWIGLTSLTESMLNFSLPASTNNRTGYIDFLGQRIQITQGGPAFTLSTSTYTEGPLSGADSVVLSVIPISNAWTATANSSWLHISTNTQSGIAGSNVIFSFDANPSATRIGTLTVAGNTVSVTQAGSSYVSAKPNVAVVSSGLSNVTAMAVDHEMNLYVIDNGDLTVKEFNIASNSLTTLVSSGLVNPARIGVDAAENVYVDDFATKTYDKWTRSTGILAPILYATNANLDQGSFAVDPEGNMYVGSDYNKFGPMGGGQYEKWTAANSNLTTLFNLEFPIFVTVDTLGNVFAININDTLIFEYSPSGNYSSPVVVGTLLGVAVDGSGNLIVSSYDDSSHYSPNFTYKWSPVTKSASAVFTNFYANYTADVAGNLYYPSGNTIQEIPNDFVDPSAKLESSAGGSDALPAVLPLTANLSGAFAPTSDQSWLTIGGVSGGVVNFSFTQNTDTASRVAHIALLGQSIFVTQQAPVQPPTLSGWNLTPSGAFQFSFTNNQNASFTVLCTTDPKLPLNSWTVLGAATNVGAGQYQFTAPQASNDVRRFYTVRSP